MSKVEEAGSKGEVIKLLLVLENGEEETGALSSFEKTVLFSPDAFGEAKRLSGRLCSKLQ